MSQEYLRFKQNFLKQHPSKYPSSSSQTTEIKNSSYKQYDPYNQYHNVNQSKQSRRKDSYNDELRIQNQSHFPFEQLQNRTFGDLPQEAFNNYKLNVQSPKMINTQINVTEPYQNRKDFQFNDYSQSDSRYENRNQKIIQNNQKGTIRNQSSEYQLRNGRTGQHFEQLTYDYGQGNRVRKYQNIDSKYIPPNRQHLINNTITNRPSSFSKEHSKVGLSPQKELPVIYQNSPYQNSSPNRSPSTYISNNSRVIVGQQQQMPVQMIQPTYISANSINQGIPISASSRVLVQQKPLPILPKHPVSGQVNFNRPSSPRIATISMPNQVIIQDTQPMVPRRQYQNLRNQCIMWQQKYHQTNDQLIRFQQLPSSGYNPNNSMQLTLLREENQRLNEKLRSVSSLEQNSQEKMKQSISGVIEKYNESLMKQCMLLVDRFKLEMKQKQKN